jgi:hypothetical protein
MSTKPEKRKRPKPVEPAADASAKVDPDSHEARRQRIRDRAGDEPPPSGTGRPRK